MARPDWDRVERERRAKRKEPRAAPPRGRGPKSGRTTAARYREALEDARFILERERWVESEAGGWRRQHGYGPGCDMPTALRELGADDLAERLQVYIDTFG